MPPEHLPSLDAVRAETAWLRRLAGALTRDDARAEDAVQETWVARLAHPPRAEGPLGGWLATVLRNAVRKRARGDSRRRGREQEAQALAGERGPDPHELAERLEAQRLVAELVLALDEPFRSTVLLRYFEDLAPSEIARRQGIPAGTVRWRLKTGLDRLRADLDRKYASPRWQALLLPLAPRRFPWKEIMGTKATTKGAALVVVLLLALAGGRALRHRGATLEAVTLAKVADGATSRATAGAARAAPLGIYRKGARTSLPRFVAAASADAAPPRFVGVAPRLDRSGEGPRNRLENPPPNVKEIQARLHAKLDELADRAEPCLAGWTAPDPALQKGVMLGIDLDPQGLQSVWVGDLVEIPTGPLRCLSDAVYTLDWGGIVDRPSTLTVPQRYARDR